MSQIFIDVREADEFAHGHVKDALNVPLSELMNNRTLKQDIPKDSEIIVYCRSGSRSTLAMQLLNKMGYTNVKNGINQELVEANYNTN